MSNNLNTILITIVGVVTIVLITVIGGSIQIPARNHPTQTSSGSLVSVCHDGLEFVSIPGCIIQAFEPSTNGGPPQPRRCVESLKGNH